MLSSQAAQLQGKDVVTVRFRKSTPGWWDRWWMDQTNTGLSKTKVNCLCACYIEHNSVVAESDHCFTEIITWHCAMFLYLYYGSEMYNVNILSGDCVESRMSPFSQRLGLYVNNSGHKNDKSCIQRR